MPWPDLPYARSVTPARFPDVDPAELERAATNTDVGTALLLENDRVRVWEITLGPGERTPFHCHRTSYFYRCESGGSWRLRTIDGEVILGEDEPGQVTYHALAPGERLVHELTNVGEEPLCYTTVELLG
jgi:predicted metal-dependent enzyme (double-stranded beta helix superfamily)